MVVASRRTASMVTAVAGAAVAAIGAFLPWVTVSVFVLGQVSVKGTDVSATLDGGVTGVLAVLAVAVVLVGEWDRLDHVAVVVLGVATVGIGALHLLDPTAAIAIEPSRAVQSVAAGNGLYATVVGGITMVVGGVLGPPRVR